MAFRLLYALAIAACLAAIFSSNGRASVPAYHLPDGVHVYRAWHEVPAVNHSRSVRT